MVIIVITSVVIFFFCHQVCCHFCSECNISVIFVFEYDYKYVYFGAETSSGSSKPITRVK